MYPVSGTIPVDIHPACASSFGRSVTVKKKLSGRGLGEDRSRSRGVILCPCSDSAPEELWLKCLPHSESRSESGHYITDLDEKRAHSRAPLHILALESTSAQAHENSGAGGETRTPTGRSPLRSERSASANSTTPALS